MCGTDTKTSTSTNDSSTTLPTWATNAGQTDYTNAASAIQPWSAYTGPTAASFGAPTSSASSFLTNNLGQENPLTAAASGAANSVTSNINPAETTSQLMNPYVAATLAPTLENLNIAQQKQTADLGSQAAMSGAFGDSSQGVQQSLLDNYNQQNIANATGQAYSNAYGQAQTQQNAQMNEILGAANTDAGLGAAQSNSNTQNASLLSNIGAQEQQAGQTGITNAIQLNTQNQTMPLSQQQTLAQILGMSPMDTQTTSSGTGTQSQPDNSGFALMGSLLSAI